MPAYRQQSLFDDVPATKPICDATASTFSENMRLPVHRWFRYSAGFSAEWVQSVIRQHPQPLRVFDPFAGSGTTLLAAEQLGIESQGVEAHPFVARIAQAKLNWRSDPKSFRQAAQSALRIADNLDDVCDTYPKLIHDCFDPATLQSLDRLRKAVCQSSLDSPSNLLVWLALSSILRKCSHAGTAQWQYVLPKKSKSMALEPFSAFRAHVQMIYQDMQNFADRASPAAVIHQTDARLCAPVPDNWANLVITSPPYPNNYDYADATRLEMCFFKELSGWSELQSKVRTHLLRSCSQHVTERTVNLDSILSEPILKPIQDELSQVCQQLAEVRLTRGGKKNYHLMIACYFLDLAQVWIALRRVCGTPCDVCFVIGDSAPYGVYVPVMDWLGRLAVAAGFSVVGFERTRDRNVKWKNRKHRVPLCEGRLWIKG